MFKLLEQGASSNIKTFLFNLKEVVSLDGWDISYYGDNNTDAGIYGNKLVISKGSDHYYFAAGIKTEGNIFGFPTHLSSTDEWLSDFEGLTLYYLPEYIDESFGYTIYNYDSSNNPPICESVNYCFTDGVIENYWIYKNDDGGYLTVIEYEVGLFTHFYFGGVKIFDQTRTIAQSWSANVIESYGYLPDFESFRPLFTHGNKRSGIGGQRSNIYYNGKFYTSETRNDDVITISDTATDTFVGYNITTKNEDFPNIMINNSGGKVYQGDGSIMGRTKVKFNDKNFPIATKIWAKCPEIFGDSLYFPFYEIDGFYCINFETIEPKEVLTFGLNEFICFPHYQKNNPQNIMDDEYGRGCGISLKIAGE